MSNTEYNPFASLQIKNFPDVQVEKKNLPKTVVNSGAKRSASNTKVEMERAGIDDAKEENIFLNSLGSVIPLQGKKSKASHQKSKPVMNSQNSKDRDAKNALQDIQDSADFAASKDFADISQNNMRTASQAQGAKGQVSTEQVNTEQVSIKQNTRESESRHLGATSFDKTSSGNASFDKNSFHSSSFDKGVNDFGNAVKKNSSQGHSSSSQSSISFSQEVNPFAKLGTHFPQKEEDISEKMGAYTSNTRNPAMPASPAPTALIAPPVLTDDEYEFSHALKDVKPLNGKGRDLSPPPPPLPLINKQPERNPLLDFMESIEFSSCSSDEYVQGHIVGLDMLILGKLQAREYKPEAHIDLHGLNSEQAYRNLIAFFRTSYQRDLRSVLLVTGRGLNSANKQSVLRPMVQQWLTHEPFKRVVLAFCSAKQEDGGTGALYVLIRKRKKNVGEINWDVNPVDLDLL